GVLFTRLPGQLQLPQMLVEAAWGLGESVVSGRVTPDHFILNAETGELNQSRIATKKLRQTLRGQVPVPATEQDLACLTPKQLEKLVALGRQLEAHEGAPRDIEWAFAAEQLFLLQSRPLTVHTSSADRRTVAIEQCRRTAAADGTVWAVDNLTELIPEPTPLTWGLLQRLLGPQGGYGQLAGRLGAAPDPTLRESAYDLIAGRPRLNLSRLPRMQFARPVFRYSFPSMKANPAAALTPQPVLNPWAAGILGLPGLLWKLSRMQGRQRALEREFPQRFCQTTVPEFVAETLPDATRVWEIQPDTALITALDHWTERTFVRFAGESLVATVLADELWKRLSHLLTVRLPAEAHLQAVATIAATATIPPEANLLAALQQLGSGELSQKSFLENFGHLGVGEMELANPRYSEAPERIPHTTAMARGETAPPESVIEETIRSARLIGGRRGLALQTAHRLREFIALRELGKHTLLRGVAILRNILLELDRRKNLAGGIFYLKPEELPRLFQGENFGDRIRTRRQEHALDRALIVPAVLFSDDLEAIGFHAMTLGPGVQQGLGLSTGVAEGPAVVRRTPTGPVPAPGYILVAPSTDPAWVPLFAGARGLVLETGGVLSHGAIVARELGLPAVAGFPGLMESIADGELLRVDGATGCFERRVRN
ncbi:MAG: PEP/pyruvate-binding domain-containing protein, partial [Gemmataceae bacterium]